MEMPLNTPAYTLLLRNWPQYEPLRKECIKFVHRKTFTTGAIDCFVDLNNYISVLYDKPDCVFDEPFSITSSILNFAAHMIYFFNSRFNQVVHVFLVYGNNRPKFIKDPEYNAHNEQKKIVAPIITQHIEEDLELLDTLIKYIPNCYYIRNNDFEPAAIIRGLVVANQRKNPRFIMSRDMYDFQLAATIPNTHIIRVKKTMLGDKTFTISYFDFYKKINFHMLNLKKVIGDGVSPELYSLYLACAGCKTRNLKSIMTWPRADNAIKGLIDHQKILNGYNISMILNPDMFYWVIDPKALDRFPDIDLMNQFNMLSMDKVAFNNLKGCFTKLYDPKAVQQINNCYFHKYPIDLNAF